MIYVIAVLVAFVLILSLFLRHFVKEYWKQEDLLLAREGRIKELKRRVEIFKTAAQAKEKADDQKAKLEDVSGTDFVDDLNELFNGQGAS